MQLLQLLAPFAPLAIVPLGLVLAEASSLIPLLIPAALLVAGSFALEQGPIAAALTVPWFAFTLLVAWRGLRRCLSRGTNPTEEFALDAGFLYLAMGGLWMLISRLGARPLAFSNEIILLTAIHFHYAGFAACVFTGMTGRALSGEFRLYRWSAWAVIGGTAALAIGITLSRWIELIAALWLTLGIVLISGLAILAARTQRAGPVAHLCISAAAASTVLSMSMAVIYAATTFTRAPWLMIPEMAVAHGTANAIGFALFGLTGWMLIRPPSRFPSHPIPFSKLHGGRFIGADFFERIGAANPMKSVTGLTDDFSEYGITTTAPQVSDFYEHTIDYDLRVKGEWSLLFRPGAKLFLWWARRIGQLGLPAGPDEEIDSRLFALSSEKDGRANPRAWVRTSQATGRVIYAAAYSSHADSARRYMNIAFPVPVGNMSSILHVSSYRDGVSLTTKWEAAPGGQQGVYYSSSRLTMRLPLNETIRVWTHDGKVVACHDMWFCGMRYLRLDYEIIRVTR